MGLVGRLLRTMLSHLHSAWGCVAFRLGWSAAAKHSFERVLALRGDDFTAYVHLGRISFAAGDYASWRREFEHARRADPRRFAKLGHPFEAFEPRLAGTDFDDTGERATWRSMRPSGGPSRHPPLRPDVDSSADATRPWWDVAFDAVADTASPRVVSNSVSGQSVSGQSVSGQRPADGMRDDCSSALERSRLRTLGPIRAQDVAACDLDELLRRLSG